MNLALAAVTFGYSIQKTKTLLNEGKCLKCQEIALDKCYSDAGRREYGISGICESCFNKLFEGDD